MSSAHKKVIVRRFLGDTIPGYLPLSQFVRSRGTGQPEDRSIDLLDLSGRILSLPLGEVKYICYVRDFNLNDTANPERLTRRTFLARPRTEGLWLRLSFRTSSGVPASPSAEVEQFEGLAPLDLSLADDLIDDAGLFLVPPDIRSNTQRIYIPRSAITELQLLAVITTPSRPKPAPASSAPSLQDDLFDTLPPSSRPN
ncbi:MAG: hypothetical protein PW789_17205 [Edaphobacter sp.]|uniref:DUF6982 domain-containing protein n=1 Tax=Edaphobacter sp. TaxID=1934404 RepID=UPI00238EEF67|nr:hypothetical protein [Edaphobacter sp.]MDE1178315.1 hypothetical protein [Edaphobacter sp.]